MQYAFVTTDKVTSSSDLSLKVDDSSDNVQQITYKLGDINTHEGKFTEYFTPELMRDLSMKKDYNHEWNNCFQEASGKHLDAHLAECLACGGRGFLGLRCMK